MQFFLLTNSHMPTYVFPEEALTLLNKKPSYSRGKGSQVKVTS